MLIIALLLVGCAGHEPVTKHIELYHPVHCPDAKCTLDVDCDNPNCDIKVDCCCTELGE